MVQIGTGEIPGRLDGLSGGGVRAMNAPWVMLNSYS